MAPGMNPEKKGHGGPVFEAAQVANSPATPAGTSSFDFNTKGLDELKTKLTGIISQFTILDAQIGNISKKLATVGGTLGKGVGAAGTAGSRNTAAPVSGGAGQSAGGGTGPGGPNNTTAPVGFSNSRLGAAAGMEVAAQMGGYITSKFSQIQSGGVPINLMAARMGGMTGGTTAANTSAFMGMKTFGQADTAAMMAGYSTNGFLSFILKALN